MKRDKKKIYKKKSQPDPVAFKDLKRQEKFLSIIEWESYLG
jgi:hypothetical protein